MRPLDRARIEALARLLAEVPPGVDVMLALDPAVVRLDRAAPDYGHRLKAAATLFRRPLVLDPDPDSGPDYSSTGAMGDPTKRSLGKPEKAPPAKVEELKL